MSKQGKWLELIKPLIVRLEVASFLDTGYTFNGVGAGAHAKFLREMARVCDVASAQEMELRDLRARVKRLEMKSEGRQWFRWMLPW